MSSRSESPQLAALEALRALFGGFKQAMRQALQSEGASALAPMHLRLLHLCQRHPGITQQGLALRVGRDKGQVARLVKDLLDHGLLVREAHPEDRRSHCLRPTPEGLLASARFEQIEARVAERLFGALPPAQLKALTTQLTALQDGLAVTVPDSEGEDARA